MEMFVIKDEAGQVVSAWPKIGKAKAACRVEMKDSIERGQLVCIEPLKAADAGKKKAGKPGKK